MNQGIFFEDVEVDDMITPLVKEITNVQLFLFAAVIWNATRIHYDADFAREQANLPGVLAQGTLQASFFAQMICDWICKSGTLRKLSWSNRAMVIPGDALTCHGKVSSKHAVDDENFVDCELRITNQRGEIVTTGSAVISLPNKERQS